LIYTLKEMWGAQKQFEKRAKLAEKRMVRAEKRGALADKRIEATWKLVETARKMVNQDRAYFKALGQRLDAAIRKRRQRPRSQAKPLGRRRSG
jgi:hypothetical protein